MAVKQFDIAGIGLVSVYKRRGARQLRLSVDHAGKIRLSMPTWLPYKTGLSYIVSKKSWLRTQVAAHAPKLYENGTSIGKQHTLYFEPSDGTSATTRIKQQEIIVSYPEHLGINNEAVQNAADKACVRALRKEAEQQLPERLQELAVLHNLPYRSVSIRQLKSRWGSCDQDKNIKLNLYLMQLPWELIDYVLLHELVHTQVMQHGPRFWQAMAELQSDVPRLRKEIRAYKTAILH